LWRSALGTACRTKKEFIPTDIKVELVNRLSHAGFVNVEAASFVSPKWVPQMADGADVMAAIDRRPGTIYSVLTPNMRGFEGALAAKADEVVIFAAASEAFSQRNINCSIEESLERFAPVAQAAKEAGLRLRGSISCSFGCPYEGAVAPSNVLKVGKRLIELGCDEIDVADTIGVGTARQVYDVMRMVTEHIDPAHVSGHFHDTYGQAIANIVASMQAGIHIFSQLRSRSGRLPLRQGGNRQRRH